MDISNITKSKKLKKALVLFILSIFPIVFISFLLFHTYIFYFCPIKPQINTGQIQEIMSQGRTAFITLPEYSLYYTFEKYMPFAFPFWIVGIFLSKKWGVFGNHEDEYAPIYKPSDISNHETICRSCGSIISPGFNRCSKCGWSID